VANPGAERLGAPPRFGKGAVRGASGIGRAVGISIRWAWTIAEERQTQTAKIIAI